MKFPRLPRLPVIRRRHEGRNNIRDIPTRASKRWWREHAEVLWANSVQFMRERDAARARVAELERAIAKLYAVLDGHDRQERDTIGDRAEGLL